MRPGFGSPITSGCGFAQLCRAERPYTLRHRPLSKMEIEAGLHHVKILADADINRPLARRAAIGHCGAFQARDSRAEAEIIVFDKPRPARRKAEFEAGAGGPAPSLTVADGEFEPGREEAGQRVAGMRPGRAALAIGQ